MSRDNVELVRRLYAELAREGSAQEFEQRMSDEALGRFLDPEIEWLPVTDSLLAVDSYRGYDGVRRFWGEFLSAWELPGRDAEVRQRRRSGGGRRTHRRPDQRARGG